MADAVGPDSNEPISLADEEAVKQVVADTIFNLWDAVNNLTRLRPSRRARYRVTIFGSARAEPGSFVYEECKRLAAAVAQMGCDIITGGGPGLMQAANEGAASVDAAERNQSMGIRIQLPFEQNVNPFVQQAFEHRTFFTRLHQFVLMSDAFVVVPGGIGTILEAMMVWQLLQVQHAEQTPLIFVGKMWKDLVGWAERYLLDERLHLANPEDLRIPRCVPTADEAVALIRDSHAKWLEREGRTMNRTGKEPPDA